MRGSKDHNCIFSTNRTPANLHQADPVVSRLPVVPCRSSYCGTSRADQMKRTQVKICGITTVEQAVSIAELGVDALGFILYPASPRFVDVTDVSRIVSRLPPFTKTVGVFVNESIDTLSSIMRTSGLDIAQLSGNESEEYTKQLTAIKINWIQSFRVRNAADLKRAEAYSRRYLLLDSWSKGEFGGTGKKFEWTLLGGIKARSRIILAGGITPDNVEEAIHQVRPFAIDVSSGVEVSPGIKDIRRIEILLNRVLQKSDSLSENECVE